MNITIYNNQSDKRTLSKYLTSIAALNAVQATEDVNMLNPSFTFNYSSSYLNANYVYVQEWGRYYFITNRTCQIGDHITIECQIDPLMSFKNAILNADVIAERSSSHFDNYMVDNTIADSGKIKTIIRKGAQVFNTATASNNYIIYLGGK